MVELTKNIRVSHSTHAKLKKLKLAKGESFENVIKRVLKDAQTLHMISNKNEYECK